MNHKHGCILVINCGSSSIKGVVSHTKDIGTALAQFSAERLQTVDGICRYTISQSNNSPSLQNSSSEIHTSSHEEALQFIINNVANDFDEIVAVGHRVVHGGEKYRKSVIVDDNVLIALEALNELAPLHNPINLSGIISCRKLLPQVANVAVFDTAFHQSINPDQFLYGVPYDWYEQYGTRRYGFHGSSYRFVTNEAARLLNKSLDELNLIVTHLGNGCSACAILQGQSVDTSMGLTPLEGLVMGTRCGDIDPGLIEHIQLVSQLAFEDIMIALSRQSCLLGLSNQLNNDMRSLLKAEEMGSIEAQRAISVFCFQVAKHLSALQCSLPSVDAIIFTGGIGENASIIRQRILAQWKSIPFRLDEDRNQRHGDEDGRISAPGAPLVMVIPTNEEYIIAQDTLRCIT